MGEYKIKVIDEKGYASYMLTGVSQWYKPEYLDVSLEYYRGCNPTKQFTLETN